GSLSNNSDKSVSIPIPPSNYTVFDIQVKSSNPTNTYTKKNVTISNGMIVTYTNADADNPVTGSPVIVIENNTGYTISGIYIKPSASTDWGSDLLPFSSLSDGKSRTFTLSESLASDNVDIQLSTGSGSSANIFAKYKFTVSDGMIVTFTSSDLTDGSNLPSITIQNRSGVNFNAIYVKPSTSEDWGQNYSSLNNNSDKSISIPIPSSSYTIFDIQMRSSNPTNTYTKQVTVTNGMVLTYTSADSDNSLTGSPVIVIENNTGYSISYIYIRSSGETSWGSSLSGSLSDGQSRAYTLSQSLSGSIDIRLGTSSSITSGNQFIKSNVSVSEGMTLNFTSSDLE
ncbi:MAG: hypothetical protein LBB36_03010, partial [Fibromonadaceae bacterium]|nr:hypothetical protein [Fibromonadaceae bacterium]